MQSPSSSLLRLSAVLVVAAAPAVGFAAGETFMNGQSIYGQPAAVSSAARVVDLAQAPRPNIAYGETVAFRGDAGQRQHPGQHAKTCPHDLGPAGQHRHDYFVHGP